MVKLPGPGGIVIILFPYPSVKETVMPHFHSMAQPPGLYSAPLAMFGFYLQKLFILSLGTPWPRSEARLAKQNKNRVDWSIIENCHRKQTWSNDITHTIQEGPLFWLLMKGFCKCLVDSERVVVSAVEHNINKSTRSLKWKEAVSANVASVQL